MPTVATSPSTLVHSCEGMYFKPSMTVRVATREARSSVFALRASRLLASRSRASLKGPIRTFYPRRVSRTASPFARRRARPLARDVTDVPRARSRASSLARASSRARSRTPTPSSIASSTSRRVASRGRGRTHRWSTRARRPRSRTWARTRSFASSISRAPIAPTSRRARSRNPSSTCARARRDGRGAIGVGRCLSSAFYRRSTHGLKRASNAWK